MRSDADREIALECLKLVVENAGKLDFGTGNVVDAAEKFYAFVTDDDSAQTLAKVREALKPCREHPAKSASTAP